MHVHCPGLAWKAFRGWQADELLHPMTCGRDSKHGPLSIAAWIEDGDKGGELRAICLECGYTQDDFPEPVLKYRPDCTKKLRELLKRD